MTDPKFAKRLVEGAVNLTHVVDLTRGDEGRSNVRVNRRVRLTGEPSDEHALQVQIYALLWSLDRELNPDVIPVTSLTVAYTHDHTKVPVPSGEQLVALRADVISRVDAARVYGNARPPAKPSLDNCTYCEVPVTIVAADVDDKKLEQAKTLGADHIVWSGMARNAVSFAVHDSRYCWRMPAPGRGMLARRKSLFGNSPELEAMLNL